MSRWSLTAPLIALVAASGCAKDKGGTADDGDASQQDSASSAGIEAHISPDEGTTADTFECTVVTTDDVTSVSGVLWTVDGSPEPALDNPLPPLSVERGQELGCEVTATTATGGTVEAQAAPITIANATPELSLSITDDQVEGEWATLSAVAADADGDGIVLSLSDGPDSAVLYDHGDGTATVIWWVPFGEAGAETTVQVAADDGIDTTETTWTGEVADGDLLPELDSDCEDEDLEIGTEWRCELEVSDPDGDTVIDVSLVDGPEGAWVDPETWELVWEPIAGEGGHYTLTLEITAGDGVAEELIDLVVPGDHTAGDGDPQPPPRA